MEPERARIDAPWRFLKRLLAVSPCERVGAGPVPCRRPGLAVIPPVGIPDGATPRQQTFAGAQAGPTRRRERAGLFRSSFEQSDSLGAPGCPSALGVWPTVTGKPSEGAR